VDKVGNCSETIWGIKLKLDSLRWIMQETRRDPEAHILLADTGFEKKVALRYGSSKLVDCLRKSGLSDSPDKIVRLGVQELLKLKNINRRRLVIISLVLEESGYIQDAKVWIKNTSNDNMAIS
jgi:hypothetical protein